MIFYWRKNSKRWSWAPKGRWPLLYLILKSYASCLLYVILVIRGTTISQTTFGVSTCPFCVCYMGFELWVLNSSLLMTPERLQKYWLKMSYSVKLCSNPAKHEKEKQVREVSSSPQWHLQVCFIIFPSIPSLSLSLSRCRCGLPSFLSCFTHKLAFQHKPPEQSNPSILSPAHAVFLSSLMCNHRQTDNKQSQ